MSRIRLPDRRATSTVTFWHLGIAYTGGVGRYDEDGRAAEVWLDAGKAGTAVQSVAHDAAVLASIALQHGATLDELRTALSREHDDTASGAIGTLLDMIARNEI